MAASMPLVSPDVVGRSLGPEDGVEVDAGRPARCTGVDRRATDSFMVVAPTGWVVVYEERSGSDRVRALTAGDHQIPIARAVAVHQVVGVLGIHYPAAGIFLNAIAVRIGGGAVVVDDGVIDHGVAIGDGEGALRVAADHDAAIEVVEDGIVG